MDPWESGATREISCQNDNEAFYDLHNNCVINQICFEAASQILTFSFSGKAYNTKRELSSTVSVFTLRFEKVELLEVSPERFLPFKGEHITDDFLFIYNEEERARFRWTGDTDNEQPDPYVDFTATRVYLVSGNR
jgi:hypothetical protein